jgi:hypothetical protein
MGFNQGERTWAGKVAPSGQPLRAGDRLDLVVLVGVGVVPGHVDGARRVLLKQRSQQFGCISRPRLRLRMRTTAGVAVERPDAVALGGLGGRRRDHHQSPGPWDSASP